MIITKKRDGKGTKSAESRRAASERVSEQLTQWRETSSHLAAQTRAAEKKTGRATALAGRSGQKKERPRVAADKEGQEEVE